MLDFQKLIVYQKAIDLYSDIQSEFINTRIADRIAKDQLRRAYMSVVLNIAEGTSRFSNSDRKHFYTIARGSNYVAIFDLFKKDKIIGDNLYQKLTVKAEEIVKILFSLEKKLTEKHLEFDK